MSQFGFSPKLDAQILQTLEAVLAKTPKPWFAAFDADGTLWDMDMGENFFDYQIYNCGLKTLPEDPWKHYEDMKLVNHEEAYVWLAAINDGKPLEQVRAWAQKAVDEILPVPAFAPMVRLIAHLQKLGVQVYIVTASIKWAVEPAARAVGLTADNVIGIETEVVNGVVGTQAVHPITWREGKAKALLAKTGGVRPVLCAGNTPGDQALIESSVGVKLAIRCSTNSSGELFESESSLFALAQKNEWLAHQF